MKSKYTLNWEDWLCIALIIVITFFIGTFSDNPVRFFAIYAVMLSVTTRYQMHKMIEKLEG